MSSGNSVMRNKPLEWHHTNPPHKKQPRCSHCGYVRVCSARASSWGIQQIHTNTHTIILVFYSRFLVFILKIFIWLFVIQPQGIKHSFFFSTFAFVTWKCVTTTDLSLSLPLSPIDGVKWCIVKSKSLRLQSLYWFRSTQVATSEHLWSKQMCEFAFDFPFLSIAKTT